MSDVRLIKPPHMKRKLKPTKIMMLIRYMGGGRVRVEIGGGGIELSHKKIIFHIATIHIVILQ